MVRGALVRGLVVVGAVACGGSGTTTTPDSAVVIDAPPAIVDAPLPSPDDAAPGDAPPDDAAPAPVDAPPGAVDASTDAPSGGCGGVGDPCTTTCPGSLICYVGGTGGVCAPDRPGCGGFAGATCDDPAAPICMYLTGTDYGICVSDREEVCVCTGSPGVVDAC